MTAKRTSLLSIGGATYDLFVPVDAPITTRSGEELLELKAGAKLPIETMVETAGGGAANSSVGLARLGFETKFCGVISSDMWGQRLLETLHKEGVDTSSATIVEHETSGFSLILLLSNGERIIFNHPGVNEHLHDATFDVDAIKTVDAVYLNRLSETACIIEDDITNALLQNTDCHLTWNPGGCQLEAGMHARDKKELLKRTTLLLLNKEEAMKFTGLTDMAAAMRALHASGVKYVVITDGKNGAFATDGNELFHCAPPETKIVDTTGAGDAFGIAMTWAILRGEILPKALVAGTLNAVSVLSAIGAQTGLLTESELREQLAHNPITIETSPW